MQSENKQLEHKEGGSNSKCIGKEKTRKSLSTLRSLNWEASDERPRYSFPSATFKMAEDEGDKYMAEVSALEESFKELEDYQLQIESIEAENESEALETGGDGQQEEDLKKSQDDEETDSSPSAIPSPDAQSPPPHSSGERENGLPSSPLPPPKAEDYLPSLSTKHGANRSNADEPGLPEPEDKCRRSSQ